MAANDPNVRIDIVPEELWQKILEAANNPLPKSEASDKGKFLHLNESTGAPEWAEGGGVLVVNVSFTYDDVEETWSFTTDKTFAEIVAADTAGQKILAYCTERGYVGTPTWLYVYREDDYTVVNGITDISAGAVGAYYELSFSMDADENVVDVHYWQKLQE